MATIPPFKTRTVPADPAGISAAAKRILAGDCIAVPTETVYGLAADATNAQAVAALYAAKGRPQFNPLIVHVPDLEQAEFYAVFDDSARALAKLHWPGPLTLVLPARAGSPIASLVQAGLETLAIRVPAHPIMQGLLKACDRPLSAPSANASGSISPTRAQHVARSLSGRIPLILDGGATALGLESTIVKCGTGGEITLLRAGPIILDAKAAASGQIEAPGQLSSHYAPSKPVRLNALSPLDCEWMIGFGAIKGNDMLSSSGDLVEAAARLFDCLHTADATSSSKIAVAPIPHEGIGIAINDRLMRAAAR